MCPVERKTESRIFVFRMKAVEQRKKIYPKYLKAFIEKKKDRNAEGFGLGLSQAMKIAELYGGGIYVESTKNKGSIFTFFIPKP